MKKIILLLLVFSIVFAGVMPTYALESGVKSFDITPICANQKDRYLGINIELDKTYNNATMFVAFYMDGKLTNLTPFDVSAKKEFIFDSTLPRDKNKPNYIFKQETAIKAYTVQNGAFKDQTPDKIRIFTWDKTSLAPQTLCDNVLTQDVIDNANAQVVKSLSIVPEATQHIRKNFLDTQEDVEDGFATEWDEHLFSIMDYIDKCAIGALEDSKEHLLTSLFAQTRYETELSNIRALYSKTTQAEKKKMEKILNGSLDPTEFPTKYYDALNNSMKFLDFSLTENITL